MTCSSDHSWKQGSPEEGSMDWYHWIAARCNDEKTAKHAAWQIGGIAHVQWATMQAYIVHISYLSSQMARADKHLPRP